MIEEDESSIESHQTEVPQEHHVLPCSRNMGMLSLRSKRALLRSDVFCLSLAFVIAICCFNFGFQYAVVDERRDNSNKFLSSHHHHLEAPTARKLKNIIDVWEEDDDWEGVELRRGNVHNKQTILDSRDDEKPAESSDGAAISESTSKQQQNHRNDLKLALRAGEQTGLQTILANLGLPMTCSQIKEIDFNVVLYNSLTMCASHILLNIAKFANNRLFVEDLKDPLRKSSYPEKDLLKYVDRKPLPALFHSHTYFCSMSSTDERNITYISMVRNPLERLMSLYYSGTNAFRTAGVKVKSYNDCVVSNDNVCVGNWTRNTLVHHFCGYDAKCAQPSAWAFERAKLNIAHRYLVVGIVADFERSMKLVEVLAPTVFGGYSDLTVDMTKLLDKRIFGSTLEELTPEVKSKMEKHLEMDVKLYNFIRERFLEQLQLCQIQ